MTPKYPGFEHQEGVFLGTVANPHTGLEYDLWVVNMGYGPSFTAKFGPNAPDYTSNAALGDGRSAIRFSGERATEDVIWGQYQATIAGLWYMATGRRPFLGSPETIEPGRVYRTFDGKPLTIGGRTKPDSELFWAYSGDWYDAQGRMVWHTRDGKRMQTEGHGKAVDFTKGSMTIAEDNARNKAQIERAIEQANALAAEQNMAEGQRQETLSEFIKRALA